MAKLLNQVFFPFDNMYWFMPWFLSFYFKPNVWDLCIFKWNAGLNQKVSCQLHAAKWPPLSVGLQSFVFLFFGRPAPGDTIPIQWTVRALLTASHKMSLLIRIIEVKSLSHCSVVVSSLQQTQAQTWVGCFSLCMWSKTFNSIQVYLYSAFYDTIVAKQLYRKLSFYNMFIYCRNLICLTYDEIW